MSAEEGRARLETPAGAVDVGLDVSADAETGTVDWRLAFPDGSVGVAQSRVTETTRGTCIYSFDFRSKLKTWVYRVAVNYILDVKKSPVERMHLNFERFAEDLAEGLSSDGPTDAERSLLTEEVKIGCTLGMLQCLDRPHRLAYVLGEILEIPGPEAAEALEITADVFRKRLQHARAAILSFTRSDCGLVSDTAECACNRRVSAALRVGRIRADTFDFADSASSFQEARALVRQVDETRRALEVHRTNRPHASSIDFAHRLARTLDPPRD